MSLSRFLPLALAGLVAGASFAQTPAPVPTPVPSPAASAAAPVIPDAPVPEGAKAWILMDHASGQVLAGANIDQPVDPASITKVMTSYVVAAEVAAGRVSLEDQVLISENAWRQGGAGTDGSYSALAVNSRVKLDDVLHGLVIQSGNDAAIALAEHVGGSEAAFVQMMNDHARRLGMTNTNFRNAHGLTAEGHVMSARDIAILGRAMVNDFPDHYALYKIREFTYGGIRQYNRNGLLWKDDSVDGLKTGHTSAAGYCLAASAKRGDQRLISVVLGIDTTSRNEGFRLREQGNLALLNWGFRHFETHAVYGAGEQVAEHKLWRGEADVIGLGLDQPLLVTVPRGRYGELKPSMDVPRQLSAPIAKGQAIGTLRLSLDGKVVAERPLLALADVAEGGFFKRLSDDFWLWWESE
ncbi:MULTISPECIES: D-alanyl-D-alanine carboxypeptidase family protein [unclassified Arenimonas]|uniref:D-alanyl-D-alanine carboxypeptidase family protein n=1 Tax=unclassified Arenimonas TaxID=2641713 RepID=UPI00086C997A|nr:MULTISPECIES: D-alanyl-D-alanine carboxypeptidase family protein [unclassified Arenimonas]ODS61831.1 MAG: serine-type D-Ala-D-Ala carboxypeptidase [Arenimonas sp. SCN 70-307]